MLTIVNIHLLHNESWHWNINGFSRLVSHFEFVLCSESFDFSANVFMLIYNCYWYFVGIIADKFKKWPSISTRIDGRYKFGTQNLKKCLLHTSKLKEVPNKSVRDKSQNNQRLTQNISWIIYISAMVCMWPCTCLSTNGKDV